MKSFIEKILNEYVKATNESLKDHTMGAFVRSTVPNMLRNSGMIDVSRYLIKGSVGQGRWAEVPWIAILDKNITSSATKGVYIVYLFDKNGDSAYVSFAQACEDEAYDAQRMKIESFLQNVNETIQKDIDLFVLNTKKQMKLGDDLSSRGRKYEQGAILYKKYDKGNLPPEEELKEDLSGMLRIYQSYVASVLGEESVVAERGEKYMELDVKKSINKIKTYISSKGFHYEDGIIENFYLSLKSKPFVLLAGTSGTGKTKLVKLFAEAIGATKDGRYKLVPVRPDWSDSSDLLGHIDLNGNFVPGTIYEFVKRAMGDKYKPYFLCLDEMNLARVEYYFSDFLSIVETRDMDTSGNITTDVLYTNKVLEQEGTELYIPENLYVIGTVNMDETTFPFSKKVLDRANTIEFSYVDLNVDSLEMVEQLETLGLDNEFLKTKYLLLADCKHELEYVKAYADTLQKINQILQKADAHIGYRVRDEFIFYLLNNKEAKLIDEKEAFDNELMQKILPRIQGSSLAIKDMLCGLFELCFDEPQKIQTESDNVFEQMYKQCDNSNCKYKRSARKIAFMVRRFEEDGFTSYWL